jgi:hypothetical protein
MGFNSLKPPVGTPLTVSCVLVKEKEMFYFEQGLPGKTLRLIADNCQYLKKLTLDGMSKIDDDVIHVMEKLGKQLTTLVLDGNSLTDAAYLYLKNCPR